MDTSTTLRREHATRTIVRNDKAKNGMNAVIQTIRRVCPAKRKRFSNLVISLELNCSETNKTPAVEIFLKLDPQMNWFLK